MPYNLISDRYFVPNDDAVIYRYLNERKAVDLLTTSEIHFTRISDFPKFDEIMFSLSDKDWIRSHHKHLPPDECEAKTQKEISNYETFQADGYINCWTNNTIESPGLWRDYTKDGNGIAVQSTVGQLKNALAGTTNQIQIARVHYFDSVGERLGFFNGVWMLSRKITDFSHECEIRQIILLPHTVPGPANIRERIDLNSLVGQIILSPNADPKFIESINKLTTSLSLPTPIPSSLTHR
jgi:hypothetical protein